MRLDLTFITGHPRVVFSIEIWLVSVVESNTWIGMFGVRLNASMSARIEQTKHIIPSMTVLRAMTQRDCTVHDTLTS